MRLFSAVMQGAFCFAVFPKRLMTYNPMQYVKIRQKQEGQAQFSEDESGGEIPTITHEQYPALLPVQVACFTGLRIGEVCALTWQDIDIKEHTITVRPSMRYNGARHKTEISTTMCCPER